MLDLVLLIILLLSAVRGYHAGLFMGIKNIVSALGGLVLSSLLTRPVTLFLTEHTGLKTAITQWLTNILPADLLPKELPQGLSGVADALPPGMLEMIQTLTKNLGHLMPQELFSGIGASLADWLAGIIISSLTFAAVMVLSVLILRLLFRLLGAGFDLTAPTRFLNHSAGAVLYVLEYIILAGVLLYALSPLLEMSSYLHVSNLSGLQQAIDQSLILRSIGGLLSALGLK